MHTQRVWVLAVSLIGSISSFLPFGNLKKPEAADSSTPAVMWGGTGPGWVTLIPFIIVAAIVFSSGGVRTRLGMKSRISICAIGLLIALWSSVNLFTPDLIYDWGIAMYLLLIVGLALAAIPWVVPKSADGL